MYNILQIIKGAKMFEYSDGTQNELDNIQHLVELSDCAILKFLRKKQYSANHTPLSFRIINSWAEAGLLDDDRQKPHQGWRKFSAIDVTLMAILVELRNFGLSLETLKNVKESLYLPAQESDNPNSLTRLEFALMRSEYVIDNGNTYLLIDNDGNTGVITERDIGLNRVQNKLPDSYIYINFNKVIKRILKDIPVWGEDSFWLYRSEWALIQKIRLTDDKKDITVKANKNRISMVEENFSGKPESMENLHNLINNVRYGQINLTVKDGKVSYLQGKTQKKNEAITD